MSFLAWPCRLRRNGVLGMNARINKYLSPLNARRNFPRVDNKVITARLCLEAGIPSPQNYCVLDAFGQINELARHIAGLQRFVIKPASGSMGNGILVLRTAPSGNTFRKPDGKELGYPELRYHIQNILSGLYSLAGHFDQAIVQYCIETHAAMSSLGYQGVPDIRIIIYRGYPVMAMARLPTRLSGGRANLHQGAIGLGVDIRTGLSNHAVWDNRLVATHPDTGLALAHIQIPFWQACIRMAIQCFEVAGLGYLGVDIALDQSQGPLLLEMNARPGLSIQIANQAGLKGRLQKVDALYQQKNLAHSFQERWQRWQAQDLFLSAPDNPV
ncbi:MAG: alpha-L-glutamate ligase-like protein [Leptospiraceae bacterium]|nr:alpha-L-glutamate ligase-like protein [Leptospiraceae bacterium]